MTSGGGAAFGLTTCAAPWRPDSLPSPSLRRRWRRPLNRGWVDWPGGKPAREPVDIAYQPVTAGDAGKL